MKYFLIVLSLFTVILLWVFAPQITKFVFHNDSSRDPFVAIGALYSGLAFVALIVTILIQIHTLNSQKDDFKKMMRARSLNTLISNHQWVASTLSSSPERQNKLGITPQDIGDAPAKYYKELMTMIEKEDSF